PVPCSAWGQPTPAQAYELSGFLPLLLLLLLLLFLLLLLLQMLIMVVLPQCTRIVAVLYGQV
ncbi:MAG: hypothetical protein ABJ059_14875, partial [Hyphomicrobiales bacterium]